MYSAFVVAAGAGNRPRGSRRRSLPDAATSVKTPPDEAAANSACDFFLNAISRCSMYIDGAPTPLITNMTLRARERCRQRGLLEIERDERCPEQREHEQRDN